MRAAGNANPPPQRRSRGTASFRRGTPPFPAKWRGMAAKIGSTNSLKPLRPIFSSSRAEEGWLRRQKNAAKPLCNRRSRGGAGQQNRFMDQHHPSRRYRVGSPLLGSLEELEIGLNVFNELDDADFSRYSSPTGEKYRSSSSETGRPAATPLRRGVLGNSSVALARQTTPPHAD